MCNLHTTKTLSQIRTFICYTTSGKENLWFFILLNGIEETVAYLLILIPSMISVKCHVNSLHAELVTLPECLLKGPVQEATGRCKSLVASQILTQAVEGATQAHTGVNWWFIECNVRYSSICRTHVRDFIEIFHFEQLKFHPASKFLHRTVDQEKNASIKPWKLWLPPKCKRSMP